MKIPVLDTANVVIATLFAGFGASPNQNFGDMHTARSPDDHLLRTRQPYCEPRPLSLCSCPILLIGNNVASRVINILLVIPGCLVESPCS